VLLVFHDSDACLPASPHLDGLGNNLQHRPSLVRDSQFDIFEFDFSWSRDAEADDDMCILLELQKLPPRG
jgi:hypothetical protein